MSNTKRLWVDPGLSAELATLRAAGEGQELEYIGEFPTQARELGKEVAAFATSNAGTVLLGVGDNGDLLGLQDVDSTKGRDRLVRRLEGICHGIVNPAVTPKVRFAEENGLIVLVISVPKGQQPVYYCNHVPYLRHISESRPAAPQEVVNLVAASFGYRIDHSVDAYALAVRELVHPIAEILIYAAEVEDRRIDPWLGQLMSTFSNAATAIRSAATSDELIEHDHSNLLCECADAADAVGAFRHTFGRDSWHTFSGLVATAAELAGQIDAGLIRQIEQDPSDTMSYLARVRAFGREVAAAAERFPVALRAGRAAETQARLALIGANLLHALTFPFNHLPADLRERLRSAAQFLHLLETRRRYETMAAAEDDLQDSLEDAAVGILEFTDRADRELRDRRT